MSVLCVVGVLCSLVAGGWQGRRRAPGGAGLYVHKKRARKVSKWPGVQASKLFVPQFRCASMLPAHSRRSELISVACCGLKAKPISINGHNSPTWATVKGRLRPRQNPGYAAWSFPLPGQGAYPQKAQFDFHRSPSKSLSALNLKVVALRIN